MTECAPPAYACMCTPACTCAVVVPAMTECACICMHVHACMHVRGGGTCHDRVCGDANREARRVNGRSELRCGTRRRTHSAEEIDAVDEEGDAEEEGGEEVDDRQC